MAFQFPGRTHKHVYCGTCIIGALSVTMDAPLLAPAAWHSSMAAWATCWNSDAWPPLLTALAAHLISGDSLKFNRHLARGGAEDEDGSPPSRPSDFFFLAFAIARRSIVSQKKHHTSTHTGSRSAFRKTLFTREGSESMNYVHSNALVAEICVDGIAAPIFSNIIE